MRGMDETYGMGAGASVQKGKTAKQVRRARKAIDAKKSVSSSSKKSSSVTDASSRMSYRAPGTKAKAMPRRSADAYRSPKKDTLRPEEVPGAAYRLLGRIGKSVQNKAGDKNKKKK